MRVDKVKGRPPDFQSVERGVQLSLPAIEAPIFTNSNVNKTIVKIGDLQII